jgi:hypothetical protein
MAWRMWSKMARRLFTPEEQFKIETELGISHIGPSPTRSIGKAKAEDKKVAAKKK